MSYNVMVVGNKGVGKTSLIIRLLNGQYDYTEKYVTTNEVNVYKVYIRKHKHLTLNVWEIPHFYNEYTETPLLKVNVAVVVLNPFLRNDDSIEKWLDYVLCLYKNAKVLLCVNKMDLYDNSIENEYCNICTVCVSNKTMYNYDKFVDRLYNLLV